MSYAEPTPPDVRPKVLNQLAALPQVRLKLNLLFAVLSALGGVVLAFGQATESIALIAVFAAAFGFVFVDWLRVFHLPPVGAYVAMAAAATYCVYDFWRLQQSGQPQMLSVALLLVLVQGILMSQPKSRRILEQLAVFCLLELVVAAIFNDAFRFGLLLIPIAIVGGLSLSLLSIVSLTEDIEVMLDRPPVPEPKTRWQKWLHWILGRERPRSNREHFVATASPDSVISIYRSASGWSRYALWTLAPAILVTAGAFFFLLPRTVEPSRAAIGGPALVGFDDQVRLEQLGQVMQNPKIAMKVELTTGATDVPYRLVDSLYLRGKVLEEYQADFSSSRPTAQWTALEFDRYRRRGKLPPAVNLADRSSRAGFDDVQVTITCESMSRPALFAIAPYHSDLRSKKVVHDGDRWTLSRRDDGPPFPRMTYGFSTYAFTRGVQTRWIAERSPRRSRSTSMLGRRLFLRDRRDQRGPPEYYEALLQYDRREVPSAARLAVELVDAIPPQERTLARIARELEVFLATSPRFQYTLDLNAKPIPNVDPIEQFLSSDRRGHCQYFASALALMLRSVGIPCRVVVGYRTEEFNTIGNYYIARQQHAHAWVEALIPADQLPTGLVIPGQPRSEEYWMRLDPTPGVSTSDDGNQTGVRGLLDTANNLWEDYVVEMDGDRQSKELVDATGLSQVQDSYRGVFERLEQNLSGRLQGRSTAPPPLDLSGLLPLMIPFVAVGLIVAAGWLLRYLPVLRRTGRSSAEIESPPQAPSIPFYRQALAQLERVNVRRNRAETPSELAGRVERLFPTFERLTQAFVAGRYGQRKPFSESQLDDDLAALASAVERRLKEATD